ISASLRDLVLCADSARVRINLLFLRQSVLGASIVLRGPQCRSNLVFGPLSSAVVSQYSDGTASRLCAHMPGHGRILCHYHLSDPRLCWTHTDQYHPETCHFFINGGVLFHLDIPLFQHSARNGNPAQRTALRIAAVCPAK